MAIIYRVEREDGSGPYRGGGGFVASKLHGRGVSMKTHPTPFFDGRIAREPECEEFCGFESRAHLEAWFDDQARHTLAQHDFFVGVYYTPLKHATYGRRQALFYAKRARWIRDEPLE